MRNSVRALRFFALLLAVLIAFIATPTFEWKPLATHLPADLFEDWALFTLFHQWVMQDLARFALLLTGGAGLTFGLLTTPWPLQRLPVAALPNAIQPPPRRRVQGGRRWAGVCLIVVALIGNGAAGTLYFMNSRETALLHGLWVSSLLLFLVAAGLLTNLRRPPAQQQQTIQADGSSVTGASTVTAAHPHRVSRISSPVGWPRLLALLFFAFLLYGWSLTTLPGSIDEATARVGLHVLTLKGSEAVTLFAPIPALSVPAQPLFGFALTPTALFTRFSSDLLFGTRVAGLMAALLCTLGIWLVGTEIFARPVDPDSDRNEIFAPIEDNGQSLTAVATLLLMANMGVLYYSRLPIVLTATAWGIVGSWALLRGIRLTDRLALALSGMLIGLGLLFHNSALAFGIMALLWWLGFGAVRLGLLPHRVVGQRGRTVQGNGEEVLPLGIGDFLLWLLGVLLVTFPFLPALAQASQEWFSNIRLTPATNLSTLLTSFAPPVSNSLVPIYPAPLLNLVLLPLIPLALGALIFNLDRRQGWLLATWLLSALGAAMLLQQQIAGWEYLLPLMPAGALAMTFTLDRLRVTLLRVGLRWLQHFLTFFLLGLVLWIVFHNSTTYYTFARQQSDTVSTIGRVLRNRAPGQPAIILQRMSDTPIVTPDNRQLLFFTNGAGNDPTGTIQFAAQVPEGLVPGTLLLVLPQENYWLTAIEAAYPVGEYSVTRDHYANPLLYLYTISSE